MMVAQPLISARQPTQGGEACVCTIHPKPRCFARPWSLTSPQKPVSYNPPPPPPTTPAGELQMYIPKAKRERRDVSLTRPTCVMSCHAHRVFPLLAPIRPPPAAPALVVQAGRCMSSACHGPPICRVPLAGTGKSKRRNAGPMLMDGFLYLPRLLCPFPLLLGQPPTCAIDAPWDAHRFYW